MIEESKRAEFLVADHFEITGRGVVVLGKILSGAFRAGMLACGMEGFSPLTITSVESLRGTNADISVGIAFREHSGLQTLRDQFPIGSVLTAHEKSIASAL